MAELMKLYVAQLDVFDHVGVTVSGTLLLLDVGMATLQSTLSIWMLDTMQSTAWQIRRFLTTLL